VKSQIVSLIIVAIITLGFPSLAAWRPDNFLISTLYNVCAIMFSIGLGLIVTFNMSGVKNLAYVKIIRDSLRRIRNAFLRYFTISTLCLVMGKYFEGQYVIAAIKDINIVFSPMLLFFIMIIYSIIFFIVNFLNVQKLSHDIFDKLYDEQKNSH